MANRSSVSWRLAAALTAVVPLVLTGLSSAAPASPAVPHAPLSGLLSEGSAATLVARAGGPAQHHALAAPGSAAVTVGANVDLIGKRDVTQKAVINGQNVNTCNAGKETAQNETTIAANPDNPRNLVAGANDYRLYEPSENRYDSSGGFYRSTDGGATWSAGFLPGVVRANPTAPGPYMSAGDPSVSAGPAGVFWYSNLDFNRGNTPSGITDSAVSISRSTDGGKTWATHFAIRTPASNPNLVNDKDWIGADPLNANVAYVTWTQFKPSSTFIVISKTTDGGVTWSKPKPVSPTLSNQGSVVLVDSAGTVHVVYESFDGTGNHIAYSTSTNGGATFTTKQLAVDSDIPSPLPGSTFRTDSFPSFALSGTDLHVAWAESSGSHTVIAYVRSTNGGATWSSPKVIGALSGDQFFPWIAAHGTKVMASWFYRAGNGNVYVADGTASSDGGAHWSAPFSISTVKSDANAGNLFGFPNCAASFVGDYSGITVGSDGIGHSLWTDIRPDDVPGDMSSANQDPYTATLTLP